MEARKIVQVIGRGIPIPGDDIDTDRITPARFLKAITFEGMEKALFCDERENRPDHPLDNPDYKRGTIMFVGTNFGSGSSREHAPQAIQRYGVEAIVGVSFAEIFAGNCFAIGLPLLSASPEDIERLIARTQSHPSTEYTVDLEKREAVYGEERISLEMNEDRRRAYLGGTWNVLVNLKANLDKTRELAAALPYISGFRD